MVPPATRLARACCDHGWCSTHVPVVPVEPAIQNLNEVDQSPSPGVERKTTTGPLCIDMSSPESNEQIRTSGEAFRVVIWSSVE